MEIGCTICNKKVLSVDENKKEKKLSSHGICGDCGLIFCLGCLQQADGHKPAPWPIKYLGYSCKPCYKKDIPNGG